MRNAPTPEQLGGILRAAGSRPVGRYDVSPVARGAQDMAEGGTRLGQSIAEVGQSTAQLGRLAQLSEATDANAYIHARLIGIRQRYNNDPNYATLAQRWDDVANSWSALDLDPTTSGRSKRSCVRSAWPARAAASRRSRRRLDVRVKRCGGDLIRSPHRAARSLQE
jgi:hypothetical protein